MFLKVEEKVKMFLKVEVQTLLSYLKQISFITIITLRKILVPSKNFVPRA